MLPALSLAAALAPAAAAQEVSTELFGEFRYSYNRVDAGDSTYWASANNASRLGVRGEISEAGLTAFIDLQAGVNVDSETADAIFTQRHFLAGVRGGFGTITVGRHSTAYKSPALRLDPFFDTSSLSTAAGVPSTGNFSGATFGLSALANGWADRALAYNSPAIGGVSANAAIYIDPDSDHDYAVGLGYQADGLDAGVQYHNADGARNWAQVGIIDHALRGYVLYNRPGEWSLGASYERLEPVAGDRQDYLYAAGTVNVVPRVQLAASLGHVGEGALQAASGLGYQGGIFVTLVPGAQVHALYSRANLDDVPDRANFALGLTYAFAVAW